MYASSPVVNLDLDYTRDAKNIRGYQNTGGARGGWDRGARARGGGLHRGRRGGGSVLPRGEDEDDDDDDETMTTVGR